MTVYIDNDCKCHVSDDGTMKAVEVSFPENASAEFIEGYRYIPEGESWFRSDGVEFTGEMLAPHQDYVELQMLQLRHEQEMRADMEAALAVLLGGAE